MNTNTIASSPSFSARADAFNRWLSEVAIPIMWGDPTGFDSVEFAEANIWIDCWVDVRKMDAAATQAEGDKAIAFDARHVCHALGIKKKNMRAAIQEAAAHGVVTEMLEQLTDGPGWENATEFSAVDCDAARALAAFAARQDQGRSKQKATAMNTNTVASFPSSSARADAFNRWLSEVAIPIMWGDPTGFDSVEFAEANIWIDCWVDVRKMDAAATQAEGDKAIAFDARHVCHALGIKKKNMRAAIQEAAAHGVVTEMVEMESDGWHEFGKETEFNAVDCDAARALAAFAARQDQGRSKQKAPKQKAAHHA